jgi:hypothetical protein
MSATSTNAMRQFGTALGCCAIGVLTLTMSMCALPEVDELPSWAAAEAERSRKLDEQMRLSVRYAEVIRQIDDAVASQGLPLREAAARLMAAAQRIDPDQLRLTDTFETRPGDILEKLARQLLKRFRTEFQAGNPNRLPGELLQRLEGELAEMSKPDAPVTVPKKSMARKKNQ